MINSQQGFVNNGLCLSSHKGEPGNDRLSAAFQETKTHDSVG